MKKKTAIVIGTGAGGATMARALQGRYQVTMLEAGGAFRPFTLPLGRIASLRRTGLFLDERMIRWLFPHMLVEKAKDMIMVRGIGEGGTTTLATGNALRYDGALKAIGIDLDAEFEVLDRELPVTTAHAARWSDTTKRMYRLFEGMGLNPVVTPKFVYPEKCAHCGKCALGCPTGAKWDTRAWVDDAVRAGARLETACRVTALDISRKAVTGVRAIHNGRRETFRADLVILAAGGLGTPAILESSGIACSQTLFVDPVLCVARQIPGLAQDREIMMPFISQQEGYILSPYVDFLSFFFNKAWRRPLDDIASVMIKLADEENGAVTGGRIDKGLTPRDQYRLQGAVEKARAILERMGVAREKQFLGTLNAGHPGGMLPLTKAQRETLHDPRLPDNLYVADATILPKAMGNPPILTIMALSRKIASLL